MNYIPSKNASLKRWREKNKKKKEQKQKPYRYNTVKKRRSDIKNE